MTLLGFHSSPLLHKDLLNSARGLMVVLGYKDMSTRDHCSRVGYLSYRLGLLCGLSEIDLARLKIVASLHDIGKIGIDQTIITKPGPLDKAERTQVEKHSVIGANIITAFNVDEADSVSTVVRHHHENFDGSGYPDRLKKEEIPFLSRIVSIVDCFDAISDHRPYHGKRSKLDVLNIMELEQNSGKFDPYFYEKSINMIQ